MAISETYALCMDAPIPAYKVLLTVFLSFFFAPSSLPPFGSQCRPVHNSSLVCCHMGMNSDTTSSQYDRSNSLHGYRNNEASIIHGGKETN